MKHTPSIFFLLLLSQLSFGQSSNISGKITDSLGVSIPLTAISVEGTTLGAVSNEKGEYRLALRPNKIFNIVISHSNFKSQRREITLQPNETLILNFVLVEKTVQLQEVDITSQPNDDTRKEAGAVKVDPKTLQEIPTPFMDFNQALLSGAALGMSSNSELSSAYSVRGGNFDENLVYVNNMQIYRPFLVRAGQQEGLSFINPDLVKSVEFSSGGWQAKYGDKLSSSLNVDYKTPQRTSASMMLGLLGGSAHLEGISKNKKLSYLVGARHKSSKYLLGTLETQGEYLPRFTDIQTFLTYDLSGKNKEAGTTTIDLLASYARNRYELTPTSRVTTFGTFNQVFRLNVGFVGNEELSYDTFQGGLRLKHKVGEKFTTSFITSAMGTKEREFVNVEGGYQLCDIGQNLNTGELNSCVLVRGIGSEFRYARNFLEAEIYSAESRNTWEVADHTKIEFGARLDYEKIDDKLHEYSFLDSAEYVQLTETITSENELESQRMSGYLQASHAIGYSHSLTYGLRATYWTLNEEWIFSPRLQYALQPDWYSDIVFTASVGLYQQQPFYREMRDFEGNVNTSLKAQSSLHTIVGMDYDFFQWGRPFKFITEVYYKKMWNLVPYDIDNVRLRYYAENNAVGYAWGADFRISGEFIPNTESWFNLSILKTEEDVEEDGRGYIRRPSDQRVTISFFFQDHLPNNPSVRVNFRALYGSGLPYGPPNTPQYRNSFSSGSNYFRTDMGFSKVVKFKQKEGKRTFETLFIGLDILNVFGVSNNISFNWVPDFDGNQFAVPNSLSQRFFNLKAVLKY
ncbi:TonB-dependent receptor [Flammeovirgaceae bacterium SG7u.111]|nr:TonB-dependent receptor [Flammeovirgaceae bacterium SG7u.132]WPO36044.1 TonB-dependent receptor [Flammeovirgaceae bacterium SG7u.111]